MAHKFRNIFMMMAITAMCLCLLSLSSVAAEISDVEGHWAEEEIKDWLEKEYIQGYPDGTFRPNQSITRAEFVRLTNESMEVKEQGAVSFSDVREDTWYYVDIGKAQASGYIQGYEDGTFKPNEPITRQEVTVMIHTLMELEVTDLDETLMMDYNDAEKIPDWSADAIASLTAKGILSGYPDGSFQPRQSMTRAETVFMLQRTLQLLTTDSTIYDQAGVYGSQADQEREVVAGDMIVESSGVTLQNMTIQGNLVLAEQIEDGEVTLRNIQVDGTTFVHGGGMDSVYMEDSQLNRLEVNREESAVRVVASGTTEITETELKSEAYLEVTNGAKNGFGEIIIDAPPNTVIILTGSFQSVTVLSSNVEVRLDHGHIETFHVVEGASDGTLHIAQGATVKIIEVADSFFVTGTGRIETANVHDENKVSFETTPDNMRETIVWPPYVGGGSQDEDDSKDESVFKLVQQEQSDGSLIVQALITASDLYAAEIHLAYNTEHIRILGERSKDGMVLLETGDLFEALPVAHEVYPEKGTITFAGSLLGEQDGHNVVDAVLFEFSYTTTADEHADFSINEPPIFLTSKGERLDLEIISY